ncbi:MAG TPA: SIMPL domain-containing protein [Solirubrobacteraceae bacterium]|jgi:hypothetical protein
MRIVMAAVGAVFVGLIAVGVLGVASAETTSSTTNAPVRTVSVQGVAAVPVAIDASSSAATTAYREAMAAAVADGKEKAQFLAEKAGSSISQVQSIAEEDGYIECPGETEYAGVEPDFGSGGRVYSVAPLAEGRASTGVPKHKKKHRRHKPTARQATVQSCSLSTEVSLVYELG